ncbi:hypothetical protein PQX77_006322 [Marasmius sp. AFHP31]|nr:hypothetical protein PQX77_006322 [Marasmius sp. AFHP31]
MVYRVPTQLESFVPPPGSHISRPTTAPAIQPWRGRFIVSGMRASDVGSNQEIKITALEADGVTYCELWPQTLIFSITAPNAVPIYAQLQNYLETKPASVSLATFLPERQRDNDATAVNQTKFRTLSRLLWDRQLVAVVSFPLPSQGPSPPNSPSGPSAGSGAGLLIYPVPTSTAMLLGAVFIAEPFPDFVYSAQNPPFPYTAMSPGGSGYRGEPSVPISPTVIQSHTRQLQNVRSGSFSYPQSHAHSPQRHAPYDQNFRHSISPISSAGHEQSLTPSSNVSISYSSTGVTNPPTGYADPNLYQQSSSSSHHTQAVSPSNTNRSGRDDSRSRTSGYQYTSAHSSGHTHYGE